MEIIRLLTNEKDNSANSWHSSVGLSAMKKSPEQSQDSESLSYAAATHVGLVRQNNQDNFAAAPQQGLWLVADGMGGHAGGELAAALATWTVVRQVRAGADLKSAIRAGHHALLQAVEEGWGMAGMGTTMVALLTRDSQYEVAWVGDSRAYLWDGGLHQLTRDHSYVQWLLDRGDVSVDEARHHPQSNAVTQALGTLAQKGVRVDCIKGRWFAGQQILLCSDGLTRDVPDSAIARILTENGDEQSRVERLMEAALAGGGHDNISLILITGPRENLSDTPPEATQPYVEVRFRNGHFQPPRNRLLIVLMLLAILAITTCVGLWSRSASAKDVLNTCVRNQPHVCRVCPPCGDLFRSSL